MATFASNRKFVLDSIESEENLPVLQRVPYRIWDVSQYMDKYFPSEDNSDEDVIEEGYLLWTTGVNPTFVSIDEYETVGKARYAYALQHGCNYNDVRRKTVKNSL